MILELSNYKIRRTPIFIPSKTYSKSTLAKKSLLKGLTKLAETRVCMLACFPAGTPVAVEEGYRNIENLQTGDRVWSRDEQTGKLGLYAITHTMSRETDHLIHLRLGGSASRLRRNTPSTAMGPEAGRRRVGWRWVMRSSAPTGNGWR